MNQANSDPDDDNKLLGPLRKSAERLAAQLSMWNEIHKNADEEGQLLVEILALYTACDALDFLLVFADKHDDVDLKSPLRKLRDRLDRYARRGAPGLSLREKHLRWWIVAAVEVLIATKAMEPNEARKYACKSLKKHGFAKKRQARGRRQDITPDTIKGWQKTASSARDSWPKATPAQGRQFADRILDHVIPALKDAEE